MNIYRIIDLPEDLQHLYFLCLEDWSKEMSEVEVYKKKWFEKMKNRGLCVKIALDSRDVPGGMIQYYPIEYSPAEGKDLYFIRCIWVHGYKKGRGNFQKKGMGTALLNSAEQDIQQKGASGIACWGLSMPFWMPASWYQKHGYKKTDEQDGMILMWKPLRDSADPPRWRIPDKSLYLKTESGRLTVTGLTQGACPAMNLVFDRAKRACMEIGGEVEFKAVDTSEPEAVAKWGTTDALFIDGREIRTGPPPSYKRIKRMIVNNLHKSKKK